MLAMLYFATLIYAAWRTRPQARSDHGAASARLRPLLGVTALAILGQILIGALVRHTGGALACIDLPLCHGSLWPADAAAPLRLHMLHRIVGVLVGLVVLGASFVVYRRSPRGSALRMLALASPLLVAVQVTLGVLAITTFRGVPVVAAHLGGAALLWGLWVGAWFASAGRPAAEPRRHGRGRGAALDAGPIAGTEAA
jgi:cytochrome c oxidase assembly protein subunit 15